MFLRILNRRHELIPVAKLSGEVRLDGEDIYAAGRRLTHDPQGDRHGVPETEPVPAMSSYDNVVAGLELTGARVPKSVKDALVEESLTRAGLWREVADRLNQPGAALSGGQQQRLCIARSLAVRPRLLLGTSPAPPSTPRAAESSSKRSRWPMFTRRSA